jgi:cytochrome d ubiquinol oxidase subunit I
VAANSFGWIFTEMGRQPWVVFSLMTTENGVSPGVSTFEAATSLIVLTVLYAVLAIIELGLLAKYIRKGADPFEAPPSPTLRGPQDEDRPLTFAY